MKISAMTVAAILDLSKLGYHPFVGLQYFKAGIIIKLVDLHLAAYWDLAQPVFDSPHAHLQNYHVKFSSQGYHSRNRQAHLRHRDLQFKYFSNSHSDSFRGTLSLAPIYHWEAVSHFCSWFHRKAFKFRYLFILSSVRGLPIQFYIYLLPMQYYLFLISVLPLAVPELRFAIWGYRWWLASRPQCYASGRFYRPAGPLVQPSSYCISICSCSVRFEFEPAPVAAHYFQLIAGRRI